MHVLIVTSCYKRDSVPHSGSFVRNQAEALVARGHKVSVLFEHWMMPREILPKFFSKRIFKAVCCKCENGVNVIEVHSWYGFPYLSRFLIRHRIQQVVKAFNAYVKEHGVPDILHAHFDSLGGLICMKLKELHGIPFGITEHSSLYIRGGVPRNELMLNRCWREASFKIAVSDYLAAALISRYALKSIEVIGNLLNPIFLRPLCGITKINRDEVVFCTVCNLIKLKCVHNILFAMVSVVKVLRQSRLIIVGDGPERSCLEKEVKQLGLEGAVRFVGQKKSLDICDTLDISDVFVLASQHETFGVVCIEAMARGLPVVATKCGGPNELINELNGELVECNDVEALAKGMISVAQRKIEFYSAVIRQSVENKYSSEAICASLEKLYKRAAL